MVEVVIALKKEQEEAAVDVDGGEEEPEKAAKRRGKRMKKACDPHQKRACVDCTKRCARIHARVSSSSGKARPVPALPSFFKVMVGYYSETMDVPPPFAKTILNLAGSNIYLEDCFGLRWRVRVCLRDGVLSFGHGWKNFVLDHAVSCGEFLVFRQIARSVFTVQVFAPSAVERLYHCERNQRQSRKRKPRRKPSSTAVIPAVKMRQNNGESCKRKRRTTDHENDQVPIDCKMSVRVCIDGSDVPDSTSDLKYLETSEKAPEQGAAESREVSKAFTRHRGNVQRVLDGQIIEIEDSCRIFTEHPIFDATEIEHAEGSCLPTNADASQPLAMMDLNEVGIDDIYLSADIYEFENDICDTEAFSVDLGKEGLITNGPTSGSNCLEHDLPDQHSSMRVGQDFVMSKVLPCVENKQMVYAPETCKGTGNVPEHDIDINVFPAKEPLSLGDDNSSPPTDAEVPLSECALGSCNKDKCSCSGNQAAQKEDNNSGDLQRGSTESDGVLDLAANKFCIAVPAPGQTWLELPGRLPVIPRKKKQGRKVIILKDPCMRLWPVLYQCTPRFSGFITGWLDISKENSLREGDTCEFELSGNYELSFQVRSIHCCPAT